MVMPHIDAAGVKLHLEGTGHGYPIISAYPDKEFIATPEGVTATLLRFNGGRQ